MNLQEWRSRSTTEITLPSGLVVKARTNVDLLDLALGGDIPNDLLTEVSRWIGTDGKLDVELDQLAKMGRVAPMREVGTKRIRKAEKKRRRAMKARDPSTVACRTT